MWTEISKISDEFNTTPTGLFLQALFFRGHLRKLRAARGPETGPLPGRCEVLGLGLLFGALFGFLWLCGCHPCQDKGLVAKKQPREVTEAMLQAPEAAGDWYEESAEGDEGGGESEAGTGGEDSEEDADGTWEECQEGDASSRAGQAAGSAALGNVAFSFATGAGSGCAAVSLALKAEPPDYLCCPITQEIFDDPVCAEDGTTYERKAIQRWFEERRTSPKTNVPMATTRLILNFNIKRAAVEWLDGLRAALEQSLAVALASMTAEQVEAATALVGKCAKWLDRVAEEHRADLCKRCLEVATRLSASAASRPLPTEQVSAIVLLISQFGAVVGGFQKDDRHALADSGCSLAERLPAGQRLGALRRLLSVEVVDELLFERRRRLFVEAAAALGKPLAHLEAHLLGKGYCCYGEVHLQQPPAKLVPLLLAVRRVSSYKVAFNLASEGKGRSREQMAGGRLEVLGVGKCHVRLRRVGAAQWRAWFVVDKPCDTSASLPVIMSLRCPQDGSHKVCVWSEHQHEKGLGYGGLLVADGDGEVVLELMARYVGSADLQSVD